VGLHVTILYFRTCFGLSVVVKTQKGKKKNGEKEKKTKEKHNSTDRD
jgi:hypothetical protein